MDARLHYDSLKVEVKGRVCISCGQDPRIAWLQGQYALRCGCYPEEPHLAPRGNYAAQRLGELVRQDLGADGAVTPLFTKDDI